MSIAPANESPMTTDPAEFVPRLKRLVPRLRGKRVGVVGDVMLDRYLWAPLRACRQKLPSPSWISSSRANAWAVRATLPPT